METTLIDIKGMTCMGCINSVKQVLQALPGVGKVEVSLEQGRARIDFDPAQTPVAGLKAAIEDAGFEVAA
jgi:copper chaperone